MKLIKLVLSVVVLFAYNDATAQKKKDCSHNCYGTTIKSVEPTEDGCYNYTLEVSYSGDCTFGLSHFTVDTGCGEITSLSNSENWKQEIGNTDPTTGLSGFKIDDISGFGEESGSGSFTVNFTICPKDAGCAENFSCWSPVVAYKAGQCVYYDTISYQCNKLEAHLIAQNPSCAESNDGSIDIEITEGNGPFEFSWSNGASGENISGLAGGYYSVVIKDAHGDTLNLAAELIAPAPLSLTYEVNNASCNAATTGSISVQASGGSGSYSYSWSNGSSEDKVENLVAGNYELTIKDSAGCSIAQSFTVEAVSQLSISGAITNSTCGQNNGAIDIDVTGGSGNYVFTWLDDNQTEDRSQLAAGYYTVTVTDESGCEASRTFSVKENNTLKVTGAIVPTGCPEDNSGGVNLTVSGANGNLSYRWNNGDTTANLAGVGAGKYDVTVTDDSGCEVKKSFYVFAPRLSLTSEVVHPTCFGESDGSISLNAEEGQSVSWSTGEQTNSITGLSEGLYVATVTTPTGCTNTFTYSLSAPDEITYSAEIINSNCDSTVFEAGISVAGGVAPYTIVWEDGTTASSREDLSEGTYNISITDANNCQITGVVEVNAAMAICQENPENGDDDNTDGEEDPEEGEDPDGDEDDDTSDEDPDDSDEDGSEDEDNPDGGEEGGNDDDPDSDNPEDGGDSGDNGEDDPENPEDNEEDPDDGNENDGESDGGNDENPDDETDPEDNDGGNNTGGNKSCGDPFDMEVTLIEEGTCIVFEGSISYSGNKSFGLSHAVISASCGSLQGKFTENGHFENGRDPGTGLDGIKIDEINGFGEGKTPGTLKFTFELCQNGCSTTNEITFIVAYKYGQCIAYDTISATIPQVSATVTAYPNPASGRVNFNITNPGDEDILVELYNHYGIKVKESVFRDGVQPQLNINELPNDMYTYRIITGTAVKSGKIVVSNN